MQMCWAGHPGTTEQPTCCIGCPPIKWGKFSWLAFTKKTQEGSHVRRWVIWLVHLPPLHRGSIVAVGAESVPYFLADCMEVVEIAPWESWFLMAVIESGPGIPGLFAMLCHHFLFFWQVNVVYSYLQSSAQVTKARHLVWGSQLREF